MCAHAHVCSAVHVLTREYNCLVRPEVSDALGASGELPDVGAENQTWSWSWEDHYDWLSMEGVL